MGSIAGRHRSVSYQLSEEADRSHSPLDTRGDPMTRSLMFSLFTSAWIVTVVVPVGRAAPIVAGNTTFIGRAIQDVTIYGGTAFNPGPELTLNGFSGDGYFTINRQAESGGS